jgi:hypothetical protein
VCPKQTGALAWWLDRDDRNEHDDSPEVKFAAANFRELGGPIA